MSKQRVRKAVIPAAGFGTRMLPATKAQPKEMLPIVDTPIIQYVVEEAVSAGIDNILVVTGRGKRAIEDHFDAAPELELHLQQRGREDLLNAVRSPAEWASLFFIRQQHPRGLGDAIRVAREFVQDEPFAVLLPDELFAGDRPCLAELLDIYYELGSTVLGYKEVPTSDVSRYGIIDPEPIRAGLVRARDLVEKPPVGRAPSKLAIVGRYIIAPEIFHHLETIRPGAGGELQLTDALRLLGRSQAIYGCAIQSQRYDVGTPQGYLQATVEFALARPDIAGEFVAYLQRRLCLL